MLFVILASAAVEGCFVSGSAGARRQGQHTAILRGAAAFAQGGRFAERKVAEQLGMAQGGTAADPVSGKGVERRRR